MELRDVVSSNLKSIGYDARRRVLYVEFRGGALYRYSGVGAVIHHRLLLAPSKGEYFHRRIRGHYRETKLRGPEWKIRRTI